MKIPTAKGQSISAMKYFSETDINQTIVISSATGVLQKYYGDFAHYCAFKGFTVYTFDYSGIGNSIIHSKALKNFKGNLKSWGSVDQSAVVELAKSENKESQLTLIAHSIGGQLIGFNSNYNLIDKIIMVASQSGYWSYFQGIDVIKMWLFWYIIIPLLTPFFGYFPSKKLRLFENLPKNMAYEWASWGRKKEYMMRFHNETEYFFDKITAPILAWSFPDDMFAPIKTVDWMTAQYKNGKSLRMHYPKDEKIQPKHFGFFKAAFSSSLWDPNLKWIISGTI